MAADVRQARTLLELLIWERNQTQNEFAEYAETFAREHGEDATLSVRHLQRLVAGGVYQGHRMRIQATTARLLERIFGVSINELLRPPPIAGQPANESAVELRQRLSAARRIDGSVIELLYAQLGAVRRLDRQLGAIVAHDEVTAKVVQVTGLLSHSTAPRVRSRLAALLSEMRALAGWQALDLGKPAEAWQHHELGRSAVAEYGELAPFELQTAGQQAFVLIDIGRTGDAVELLTDVRERANHQASRLSRAWLAAACGEVFAADGDRSASLRAFDDAADLLPADPVTDEGPYVALDAVHLARWRGHALARLGVPEAVDVLADALDRLDPTFTRAETALRVDLATAFAVTGEREEARRHAAHAADLAEEIGSARQSQRIAALSVRLARC